LGERREALQALIGKGTDAILLSEEVALDGAEFFEIARAHGLEGIVSKRVDRPYRLGKSGEWLSTRMSLSLSAISPTIRPNRSIKAPGAGRACPRGLIPARDTLSLVLRASVHPDVGLSSSKFRCLQDFAASSDTLRGFRTLAKKLTTATLLSATRHFISDARRKMVSRALSDASGRQ
jgi:hypothetical protein